MDTVHRGRPRNPVPKIGTVFGRLTVLDNTQRAPRGQSMLRVRCECGKEKVVAASNVVLGKTTSCGCFARERASAALTKHGQARVRAHSAEYKTWCGMLRRCTNSHDKSFAEYGAKGIVVCERWADSFEAFFADMGRRPSATHSIDRFPDRNGNYEPGNCRWATKTEQARNRSTNHLVTFRGTDMPLSEACTAAELPYDTVLERLRVGWSTDRALSQPVRPIQR